MRDYKMDDYQWDVFVSHANEDKDALVRSLAAALQRMGLRVWYDEQTLTMGDSLRRKIEEGLLKSRYGVVVLSPAFFAKQWPRLELDGLATREIDGHKVILPIWHNVKFEEVRRYSPMLADRIAASTVLGLDAVVSDILKVVGRPAATIEPKREPELDDLFAESTSPHVRSTLDHLDSKEIALDGLIVLWLASTLRGIDATAVEVEPEWTSDTKPFPFDFLPSLPKSFAEYVTPYWEETKSKFGSPNNPKVWLRRFRSPSTETPTLQLDVGQTTFWEARSLQKAFDDGQLRAAFEKNTYKLMTDLPGIVFVATFIVTADRRIILAQRKGEQVDFDFRRRPDQIGFDFAGGSWSVSCEEQWDPRFEALPGQTVLRGLEEEFNLDQKHGVPVSVDNIKLLALAREWGQFWNTALIYRVDLPVTADTVLNCWSSIPPPKDKAEHVAVAALDLNDGRVRALLEELVRNRDTRISWRQLGNFGALFRGTPSDGNLHPTSGRARAIFALYV